MVCFVYVFIKHIYCLVDDMRLFFFLVGCISFLCMRQFFGLVG